MIPESRLRKETDMRQNLRIILWIAALAASLATILYAIYDFFIASSTSLGIIGGADGPTAIFISGHKND